MSDYKQSSFAGGLNLLLDDTRLPVSFKYKEGDTPYDITYNQYRLGLNLRSRFDVAEPILSSVEDYSAPAGIKQGILTFGNYIIIFCAGLCYYKLNGTQGWYTVSGFSMNPNAPRFWFVAVPLNTTNYARAAIPTATTVVASTVTTPNEPTVTTTINNGPLSANAPILTVPQTNYIAATFGNNPGLLVQDGSTQPQFLFINNVGQIQCRVTQTYAQWSFPIDDTTLQLTGPDMREYVPIGTYMEWYNGILFIVDPNFSQIYRSVSGRPLDFVIDVDENGQAAGDATYTSTSVGVNGITCLKALASNILFVSAGGGACFSITLNTTPNAPTIFGEYTFIRTQLFNSNCINEKGLIDVTGDTVFIDANGLRSFNAVEQQQNEGRNSVFSSTIQRLFKNITQQDGFASAISFDNYALFSVNTTLGYCIIVYDTNSSVFQALDVNQLNGFAAKQFASISVTTLSLFAITSNDKVYQLYANTVDDPTTIRLGAVCSQDPKKELKVETFRAVFSECTEEFTVTASLFTNNRLDQQISNTYQYNAPTQTWTGPYIGDDIGTQVVNAVFPFPNAQNGWKAFIVLSWTGTGKLTNTCMTTQDITPANPLLTQSVQL